MRRRELVRAILLGVLANGVCPPLRSFGTALGKLHAPRDSVSPSNGRHADTEADVGPGWAPRDTEEIVQRIFAREQQVMKTLEGYSAIVETRVVRMKRDRAVGIVPKSSQYFLGVADFRGE